MAFRNRIFGPSWNFADPNQDAGMDDRGGVTTVSFPPLSQQMEPVRLNTNLLLREPFAVAMDDMNDHYMIYIYQPNMRKKDISLTLLGDVLTIHASRHLRGVSYELSRELALPSDADVTQLQAEFTSGRIDVKIPKILSRRAYRSIPIHGIQPQSMDTEIKHEQPQIYQKPTPSPRRNIPITGVATQENEQQPISTPQQQIEETTPSRAGSIPITSSEDPTQTQDEFKTAEPTPAPSPRRDIPISGITSPQPETSPTSQAKQTEHQKLMPPPSPRQRTRPLGPTPPTTPEIHMGREHEQKPSSTPHKSLEMEETKQQTIKPTSMETELKQTQPVSPHTKPTRECEPFPCVDVGGIPEPQDTGIPITSTVPSATTELTPKPALESDVCMTGHAVSVAKNHAGKEQTRHELQHDMKHHPHVHHHTQQPEKVMGIQHDEQAQSKQPSIISRVAHVAKKATDVVTGTGSEQE